ncbi:hypothetical protein F6W70_13735 [Microbacterium maritypicum]|uniref:Uncharacterized protein n=1 Tax=Microbacterium maritypicum TaxID=33918 RepID=A0AAD3X1A6_MICMQ|nr:hypothetical protein [Microbacterium liquefaciens]KAB1883653.1 hypothetical protein F6W70_13735 [Microbacterium liquefaciens]
MSGVQAFRRRAAEPERTVDAAVAAVKAERAAEFEASKREHAARETARRRFTREDVVGAAFIHDGFQWRTVVRVNKANVSVKTDYSWVDRAPFEKIHAVRMEVTQ